MRKVLLAAFVAIVGFISCQKEIDDYIGNGTTPGGGDTTGSGNSSSALIGTWNFDSLSLNSQNSSEVIVDNDTALTLSNLDYTSFGNNGTLTIDDSLFKFVGLTYSISTTSKYSLYENGAFIDSSSLPIQYYLPPANSTSKYTLVGTDSVYFPEGNQLLTDTTMSTNSGGLTFKINGNALVFKQQVALDTSFLATDGYTHHDKANGLGYLYFHKK